MFTGSIISSKAATRPRTPSGECTLLGEKSYWRRASSAPLPLLNHHIGFLKAFVGHKVENIELGLVDLFLEPRFKMELVFMKMAKTQFSLGCQVKMNE